jgi:hypothetical protein
MRSGQLSPASDRSITGRKHFSTIWIIAIRTNKAHREALKRCNRVSFHKLQTSFHKLQMSFHKLQMSLSQVTNVPSQVTTVPSQVTMKTFHISVNDSAPYQRFRVLQVDIYICIYMI